MSTGAGRDSSLALQFFEGALWTAARNLLQTVLSLVALAVVARTLGPEAYGYFGIASLVISVAEMLVGSALTEAIVQRKALDDGHLDATFWLSSTSAIVLGGAIAWWAEPLARLAGGAQAAGVLTALACLLPITASSRVPMALLARGMHFRSSSQVGAVATVLSCGTGIALALLGTGIWTLVVMEVVRSVVTFIGAFMAVPWRPGRRGTWRHLTELSRLNATMLATYALGYADMLLPRLLVSRLMGAHALGLFMLTYRVYTELYQLLTGSMHGVALAACSRAQEASDELHRIVVGLYRASRLVVFPACLGLAGLAPVLIPLAFGTRWEPAVPAIQILLLSGIRDASGAFNTAILFGVGRAGLPAYLLGVGCLLHIVLVPACASWGVAGASMAVLARQFISWPLACVFVRRATGLSIRRQLDGLLPALLAAAAMASLVWLAGVLLASHLPPAAIVVVSISAGVMAYLAALRAVEPAALRDATAIGAACMRRDRPRLEALLSGAP